MDILFEAKVSSLIDGDMCRLWHFILRFEGL